MSRHIHIPSALDWCAFLANTAEIDGYLVSENELNRVRTSVAPRRYALALTNCANRLWDHATSDSPLNPMAAARDINNILAEGALEEGVIKEKYTGEWREGNTIIDLKTDFDHELAPQVIHQWADQIKEIDAEVVDFLERGFTTMSLQRRAAMAAWITQFQWGHTCPFPALNGVTGRFLTNLLRMRWSMTMVRYDFAKGSWQKNLSICQKIWEKQDILSPVSPDTYRPNLEKHEFFSL
jgi:hypothetical protein